MCDFCDNPNSDADSLVVACQNDDHSVACEGREKDCMPDVARMCDDCYVAQNPHRCASPNCYTCDNPANY